MHPNQMKPTYPTPSFKEPIVLNEQVEVTNDNNEIVMTNIKLHPKDAHLCEVVINKDVRLQRKLTNIQGAKKFVNEKTKRGNE